MMPSTSRSEITNNDIFVGLLLSLCWFGWSVWAWTSDKTPAMIFGLVAVGLIVLCLSIFFWKKLWYFAAVATLLPFYFVLLILSCLHAFMSLFFVFSVRLPWKAMSRSSYCRLCDKCDTLVATSHLVSGSPWLLAWPTQTFEYYSRADLQSSSRHCHLCSLLLSRLETPNHKPGSTTLTDCTMSTATDVERSNGLQSNGNLNERMSLMVQHKVHVLYHHTLQLRLRGPSTQTSLETKLEWMPKVLFLQLLCCIVRI